MTYYQDNHVTLYNKDCRDMSEIPNSSVQCVITSPPYWGLRKYSGLPDLVWGGDKDCEHRWDKYQALKVGLAGSEKQASVRGSTNLEADANFCSLCGAWKGAYGLEPTPEMYIEHTIQILREIRRVLRKDGVVFWNIGDSYAGSNSGKGDYRKDKRLQKDIYDWEHPQVNAGKWDKWRRGVGGEQHGVSLSSMPVPSNLKPKDLCLIPFRVAIAAQTDGWWVRSIIIWSKPNPMPESVTDRPTESHEYILMLTKSAKYYWDADAVREPHNEWSQKLQEYQRQGSYHFSSPKYKNTAGGAQWIANVDLALNPTGRNIRTVWEFPTQPYPEAHFATFPEKLPETCIKAATPEAGCCSKCGAPWMRVSEVQYHNQSKSKTEKYATPLFGTKVTFGRGISEHKTLDWQPTCKCNADKVLSIVLDPFAGSGTTLWVGKRLGRRAIGYELSEEYCRLSVERCRQQAMELTI